MKNNSECCDFKLDSSQQKILNTSGDVLVIAGAGTGKTTTIIGKIKHLIENAICSPKEILVISFTNASVNDIINKLTYDVDVFTFHKLSINILKKVKTSFSLCDENFLKYVICESLQNSDKKILKILTKYFHINCNCKNFINNQEFKSILNTIFSFINLLKANNLKLKELTNIKFTKREKKILLFFLKIYLNYILEKRSVGMLDYDDLIIFATHFVKRTKLYYKYIIVDEFQDTSYIRFKLIQAIQKKCNSSLIVVGDDWQSIYRFSGCDLNIFLNFQKMYPKSTKINLKNTYRNSQELINAASKFIIKNPLQIKKELYSNKSINNPIVLVPYKNERTILKEVLEKLINEDDTLIISRNNNDIVKYIDKDFTIKDNSLIYKNKKFKYISIHKSKGLEAKNVILLNCNNSKLGIPNKIENNLILEKIFKSNEIKYAEERRLFYVALTRTKNKVYLLYNKNCCSIFIKEIIKIIKKK